MPFPIKLRSLYIRDAFVVSRFRTKKAVPCLPFLRIPLLFLTDGGYRFPPVVVSGIHHEITTSRNNIVTSSFRPSSSLEENRK